MRDHNSKSTQRRRTSLVAAVPFVSFLLLLLLLFSLCLESTLAIEILSKSKIERCERGSDSGDLNCTRKIVLNMAVPSGSSGGEASIVAEIAEVEENSTSSQMETLRVPPVITINKSAAYALYELTYIRDVAYKPQEFFVKTRKCARDAGAHIVKICERLRDEHGHIMENTQPICCPCGNQRRMPSSCGNFFDKMVKGKANTAHCLRFLGDWFHVLGIGQRSLGFSVRIEVKTSSKVSEVVVDPHNRTVVSSDNFLRVNLIGDFGGYTNLPSFEDFYLVIPRQGSLGQPQDLGRNFSMWMLLERVRFTLDGLECNKIGVSYEAFNGQPNFCSTPFWSCLHNQLWNFWDADQNRKSRNQLPLYTAEGRFERINQHPNAGSHSFSIGVTEVLTSNLLIEVSADDIEYVYQRSPGQILSITIPTFEALTQFGSATITSQNIGDVEASYSITFDCVSGVTLTEEQFFIMKPKETTTRSFKLQPTNDQAAEYKCSAILKDSDFKEVDRAECQFTTTATILDNGTQIAPFQPPSSGVDGFFGSLGRMWKKIWTALIDFISGKTCRSKCSRFFDFSCHLQYLCMSWLVMFGLFLAIFPTVMVLLWLLHQKGLFDPFYDWWEDSVWNDSERIEAIQKHGLHNDNPHYTKKHRRQEARPNYKHDSRNKQRRAQAHQKHRHSHSEGETDYYYNPPQVHKHRHKHKRRNKRRNSMQQAYLDGEEVDNIGHYKHKKQREIEISKPSISKEGRQLGYTKHKHEVQNKQFKSHEKQK